MERHDAAAELFERQMDDLAEECHVSAEEASTKMKQAAEKSDLNVNELLSPFEENTEVLGERSEEEVHGIMSDLEKVIAVRRKRIQDFQSRLDDIDSWRKAEAQKLAKIMIKTMTEAAHVVPGECERMVEERLLDLNRAVLENSASAKTIISKLSVQTLEKSKECKQRWHAGIQLWKRRRHHHSLNLVLERIKSNEFRQPDNLVECLERLRDRQQQVFDRRQKMVNEFFDAKVPNLQESLVRQWEEQNNSFNDRTQDQFEALMGELKEIKDSLEIAGEGMLSSLGSELEAHDARSEWGDFTSVKDLVDAEVRPLLQECTAIVSKLLVEVIDVVTRLDENQHAVVVKMVAWFMGIAKKQEKCKKNRDELYDVTYPGDLEDTEAAHETKCKEMEEKMDDLKRQINDAAHHQDLDKLKDEAFNHLDDMRTEYRSHAEKMTSIHRNYPIQVAELMQQETQAFCQELGLVSELALHPPPAEEGEEPPPEKEEEGDLQEWQESEGVVWPEGDPVPAGVGTGVKVFERLTNDKLRLKLVGPLGTAPPKAEGEGDEGAAAEPATEGDEGENATEDPDEGNPRQADGEPILLMLNFNPHNMQERFQGTRTAIFKYLTLMRRGLKEEIDIAARVEEVARNLDRVLRKHTNRKGEVQVEFYVPRYSVITKHKDRFERHLIEIAKKSQDADDKTTELHADIELKETAYKETLTALREKLGEAETLPMLNAFETKANKTSKEFAEALRQIQARLLHLAKDAPKELQKENDKYLLMCNEGKGDPYSSSEVKFYGAEIEELNKTVAERGQLRQVKVEEFEGRMLGMSSDPVKEFIEIYKQAVEDLCMRKGYGTEHGAPRRMAQGRCRALIARAMTAKQNILDLMDHFASLCKLQSAGADIINLKRLPKSPQFELQDYFKKANEPWVFTGELIGNLYVLTGALNNLGSHLEAFKADKVANYKLEGLPQLRVLSEAEALIPADAADEVKATEQALKDQCLVQVMGPVLRADPFNKEIEAIKKEAHDTYAGKGGTPDFMTTFLKEMESSADRARQEIALSVRERSEFLRDEILLDLGDAVYGELFSRSLRELFRDLRQVQEKMNAAWEELNNRRANHEKRLGPRLSNPNAEKELQQLIEEEANRYKAALEQMKDDRIQIVTCFRNHADLFRTRLVAAFEATFKIVDAVPLTPHFSPLPGDETVEPARMSIKRRMRRLQKGESVDQNPDMLPSRTWPGVPLHELRGTLKGKEWPKDKQLVEVADLAEPSPELPSFRSATHKKLFERRNFYYTDYKNEFSREVTNRAMELSTREAKEQAGQVNWTSMVYQLNPEAVIPEVKLEEEEEEPPPVEEPKGKGKGKK
jgi:hypothetical protein